MNLIELSELLLDEKKAEQYLLGLGILKSFTQCEKCGSSHLGRIRRGKIKCYKCKREWNQRKGGILEGVNLELKKVLLFIKLLEYKFHNHKIQIELDMDRITIKKLRNRLKNVGG